MTKSLDLWGSYSFTFIQSASVEVFNSIYLKIRMSEETDIRKWAITIGYDSDSEIDFMVDAPPPRRLLCCLNSSGWSLLHIQNMQSAFGDRLSLACLRDLFQFFPILGFCHVASIRHDPALFEGDFQIERSSQVQNCSKLVCVRTLTLSLSAFLPLALLGQSPDPVKQDQSGFDPCGRLGGEEAY